MRKPQKKAPSKRAPSSTALGRIELMMEDIHHKFDFLAEGLATTRREMREMFAESESRMNLRFEVIESVVRQNSSDIRKNSEDIRQNTQDIQHLSSRVDHVVLILEKKADSDRVTRLEELLSRA